MSRTYTITDPIFDRPVMDVKVDKDNHCLFCDHCTDVFWDFTNGPYMMICELGDVPDECTCERFEEEISDES